MKCPYCGSEMKPGILRSANGYAVYWWPEDRHYYEFFLTKKRIEEYGGVVLDGLHKIGFTAKEDAKPESCYCGACKTLITKL